MSTDVASHLTISPTEVAGHDDLQRYRNLFDHLPICIFTADLTASPATILQVNQQTGLVYGYASNEMIGMPVAHLAAEEAGPTIQSILTRVRQGETVTVEILCQRRDCTRFPGRVIAAPDPIDAERMIATVEDMSAEKQRRSEAGAIDAERRRIAQDIHDGVAQSLAGLRFKSALWSHLADSSPPAMRAAMDELQAVLASVIVELRRAIFALRPVDLEALGFFQALAQLVDDFGDQNQLAARSVVSGPKQSLPVIYELPIFRVVQEGLSNIAQHAGASLVLVNLRVDEDGGVTVALKDNGRAFDPQQLAPSDRGGHFGLRQMRERILDLHGALDIRSAPGQGAELVIVLPPVVGANHHVAA